MVITQIPPLWFAMRRRIPSNWPCFLGLIVTIVFVAIRPFRHSHESITVGLVAKHSLPHVRPNRVQSRNSASTKKFEFVWHATIEFKRKIPPLSWSSNRHSFSIDRTGSIRPQTSSNPKPPEKSQAELDEEDAFQLALSLSQSEADEKERQKKRLAQQYAMSTISYPPVPTGSAPIEDENDWETQTKKDLITIKPFAQPVMNIRDQTFDAFFFENPLGSCWSICSWWRNRCLRQYGEWTY